MGNLHPRHRPWISVGEEPSCNDSCIMVIWAERSFYHSRSLTFQHRQNHQERTSRNATVCSKILPRVCSRNSTIGYLKNYSHRVNPSAGICDPGTSRVLSLSLTLCRMILDTPMHCYHICPSQAQLTRHQSSTVIPILLYRRIRYGPFLVRTCKTMCHSRPSKMLSCTDISTFVPRVTLGNPASLRGRTPSVSRAR